MEWLKWGFDIGAGVGGFFAGIIAVLLGVYFAIALVALAFGGGCVGLIEVLDWVSRRRSDGDKGEGRDGD